MEKKYSIVIPVYNSVSTLEELVRRLISVFKTNSYSFEIIFINDGSTDSSWSLISILKKEHPTIIKGINLARNYGQHNALMCGFHHCNSDYVITMDDDLQHPPEEINLLIQRQLETSSDVIYGIPNEKKHGSIRTAGSFLVRRSSKVFANNPQGEGSSFRLIKKTVLEEFIKNNTGSYVFLDEILPWYTSKVSFVSVEHHERPSGESGYTLFKLMKLFFNVSINYTAHFLLLMIYGGIISSIITFMLGVVFIYRKTILDVPLGYTSIMVTILFSSSLILMGLGVIGKYIFNMYQQQTGKPMYAVKSVI